MRIVLDLDLPISIENKYNNLKKKHKLSLYMLGMILMYEKENINNLNNNQSDIKEVVELLDSTINDGEQKEEEQKEKEQKEDISDKGEQKEDISNNEEDFNVIVEGAVINSGRGNTQNTKLDNEAFKLIESLMNI